MAILSSEYDMASSTGLDLSTWALDGAGEFAYDNTGNTYSNNFRITDFFIPAGEAGTVFFELYKETGTASGYNVYFGVMPGNITTYTDFSDNNAQRIQYLITLNGNNSRWYVQEWDSGAESSIYNHDTSVGYTSAWYEYKIEIDDTKGAKYYRKAGTDDDSITDSGWTLMKDSTAAGDNDGIARGSEALYFWGCTYNGGSDMKLGYVRIEYEGASDSATFFGGGL